MNWNNKDTQKETTDTRFERERERKTRNYLMEDNQKKDRKYFGTWGLLCLVVLFIFVGVKEYSELTVSNERYSELTVSNERHLESTASKKVNPKTILEETALTVITEFFIALMGSFFILYFIEHNRGKGEDTARKQEIKDIFEDTLKDCIIPNMTTVQTYVDCLVKENTLISKLNDDSVDLFMRDCISHYCNELSEHYKNYIKDNINIFRRNLHYQVTVERQQNKDNKTEQYIGQDITYERFFRNCDNKTTFKLKCLFTFGTNELDEALEDDSYFFREELTNTELLYSINNILDAHPENVIDELINNEEFKDFNLEITIGNDKIKNTEIKYEVIKNNSGNKIGLLFYVNIPQKHIHYTKDSYVYYKGSVSCKYKSDVNNNMFYCIFSNPTTGSTDFTIKFDSFPDEFNINDVIRLPMLSLKKIKNEFELKPNKYTKAIHFNTKKTIFPRGGIVIRW